MLQVQVWDRGLAGAVDKAIRNSGLGLNPISRGSGHPRADAGAERPTAARN